MLALDFVPSGLAIDEHTIHVKDERFIHRRIIPKQNRPTGRFCENEIHYQCCGTWLSGPPVCWLFGPMPCGGMPSPCIIGGGGIPTMIIIAWILPSAFCG